MTVPFVAEISYAGTLISEQITTSPWQMVNVQFPQTGSIPDKPQFHLDILQPANLDSARYRVGGAHFPPFKMFTIMPVADFGTARVLARQIELTRGDFVTVKIFVTGSSNIDGASSNDTVNAFDQTTWRCVVLDVRSVANSKRVIGATTAPISGIPVDGGEVDFASDATACVDTEWTLQFVIA